MKSYAHVVVMVGSVALGVSTLGGVARAVPPAQAETEVEEALKAPERAAPELEGIFQMIGRSLNDVKLRPNQQTAVQRLGEQVGEKQRAVDTARTDLVLALADALQAGRFDHALVDSKVETLVAARVNESQVLRKALVSLHGLMTPEQRAGFVDSIGKQIEALRAKMAPETMLEEWGKDLGLNDSQKEQIRALLEPGSQQVARDRDALKNLATAFRSASFDPETIVPEREVATRAKERATHAVTLTEGVLRILNPLQREKAAAKLREAFGGAQRAASVEPLRSDELAEAEPTGAAEEPILVGRGVRGGAAVSRGWGYSSSRSLSYARTSVYGAGFSAGGLLF